MINKEAQAIPDRKKDKSNSGVGNKPLTPANPVSTTSPKPATNSGSKPVQKQKTDSPSRASVRKMQESILQVKNALEGLELGNPQDVGGYNRNQNADVWYGHGEEIEMGGGNDTAQINRNPSSFKRNIFQNKDNQKESLDGTNPIGNFLLKNYINTSGLQFSDLDVEQPERTKINEGAMNVKNFKALTDTIGHVGTPKPAREKSKEEQLLESQLRVIENKYSQDPKYAKVFENMNKEIDSSLTPYKIDIVERTFKWLDPNYEKAAKEDKQSRIKEVIQKYQRQVPELARYEQIKLKLSNLETKLDKEYYSPKLGEEKTDGIWSVRTNNALKNIYAIIDGLVRFSKDMNVPLAVRSDALNKFKSSIPSQPEKLEEDDKINLSKVIEASLNYFATDLLPKIRTSVLESQKTKTFANQTTPFMNFGKTKSKEDLQKQDKDSQESAMEALRQKGIKRKTQFGQEVSGSEEYFSAYKNSFNPREYQGLEVNINGVKIPLTYEWLLSSDRLGLLYKRTFNKTPTTPELKDFLSQIKQQMQQSKFYKEYKNPTQPASQQEIDKHNEVYNNAVEQQNKDKQQNEWQRYRK